ncbi:MAG: glycosyltransferase, partial [Bacteroidales bacterium]|nr:glycosyltransferase [Bacteroidales bacterium]
MFVLPHTIITTTLSALFCLVALIQLFYYLWFYRRTITQEVPRKGRKRSTPVSVIICARNEAENLEAFLPSVLEQEYKNFEVVVINDCSDDNSEEVLNSLSKKYSNLRVTTIHKDISLRHSKKMALFIGIKAARHELLLMTDADCQPVSPGWIESVTSGFSNKSDFVLGYGGYLRQPGLLNRYIRLDTMFIAMQYIGMARAGLPYMGVGRNLAYKKSLFFENRGFGPHLNLQSGDDDLFVNALAKGSNCNVITSRDSFTRSVPPGSWNMFIKQKTRHFSTSAYYRGATKFLLGLEPISRVLFYSLFIVLMINSPAWQLTLILFGIVFIVKSVITTLAQNSLQEKDLL